MDTTKWTEMTSNNVSGFVGVKAEKLNSPAKDNIQTNKKQRKRYQPQENSDSVFDSRISCNEGENMCLSLHGNSISSNREASDIVVTYVKPEVRNDTTSDSRKYFEYSPLTAMTLNSKKGQALSKTISGTKMNATYSSSTRNEMIVNSKVPSETDQESIIVTASSRSVNKSVKDNKCSLEDECMHCTQNKDSKREKETRGQKKICQICSMVFSTSHSLQKHVKTHAREKLFSCHDCGSTFNTKTKLSRHAPIHEVFECAHCGKKFKSKHYLEYVHLLKHSDDPLNKYRYSCSVCNKKFISRNGFQMHSMHHINKRFCACDICGKTFMSVSGRKAHMKTHTGKDLYACDHCGKSFPRFADLVNHIRVHTGERPYKCDQCGKSYKLYGDLIVHMRTHIPDPRFQCDICSKFCIQSRDLLIHKRTKHGITSGYENAKRVCEVCGRIFSTSSNYYRHKRRHHSVQDK